MDFVIVAEVILYVVYRHRAAHCSCSSDSLFSVLEYWYCTMNQKLLTLSEMKQYFKANWKNVIYTGGYTSVRIHVNYYWLNMALCRWSPCHSIQTCNWVERMS